MRARRWLLFGASALAVPALALAVSMVAALAQTSPSPSASSSPGASPSAGASAGGAVGDPTKGQQLFGSDCATCHGADMTGGIGPRLNPIANLGNTKNPLDPTYIIGVITNGLSGLSCSQFNCSGTSMPPKGGATLSEQDIKDLAAFIIQENKTPPSQVALDPHALAVEDVKWVTIGILVMVLITWLLARYNMRWIDRRVAARRERLERQGRPPQP